jgi:hypothetical protein
MRLADFSLRVLYDAVDAQRRARGISWTRVAEEMNSAGVTRRSGHRLSPSTIIGLRTRNAAEGDGVLQMLRWLNRSPESFVAVKSTRLEPKAKFSSVPPGKVLRFDTKKLHLALDARRIERGLTWNQIASYIGVSVSSLAHLSAGGRTSFPKVMRILSWLDSRAADFTRLTDR